VIIIYLKFKQGSSLAILRVKGIESEIIMMNVVRVHVPNVIVDFRYIIEDAIIEIAGCGSHPEYDYFEGSEDPVVRFLATDREVEMAKSRFEGHVDVDHVWEYIFEWYNDDEETWYKEWHQLEVDGKASVSRCNCGTDEGCFWSEWHELRSETEEEFHKGFEETFLNTRLKKLIYWN
jgi:hypothetical protein